jgi:hypothetical protein
MPQYGAQGVETNHRAIFVSSLVALFFCFGSGNFEGRQVEAAILLIGEYPALLSTRVQLLKEWQTSTTDSEAAAQALRKRRYDLLISCQSIRGSTVQILIAHARTLYPDIMVLTLSYAGELPELSGIELAIRMKALHPRCKILLRSGHAGTLELLCDGRHRGNHFRLLLKPIFPTEMLSEINKTEDVSQPKGGLHLIR